MYFFCKCKNLLEVLKGKIPVFLEERKIYGTDCKLCKFIFENKKDFIPGRNNNINNAAI